MTMTEVLVSGRVLDKQVGGNTRYARTIYAGLANHGVTHRIARVGGGRLRSVKYGVAEGLIWPLAAPRTADVLHFPADTGAVISGRTPIVGTVHGLATLHLPNVRKSHADRLWKARVARLVEVSSRVITVSHSSADDIVTLVPGSAGKIVPILHGIDHSMFSPTVRDSDAAELEALGVAGPYFLYLGNLDPRKNVIELCIAASEVFKQTGIPLLVSGAPAWDSDEILRTVQSTEGVRYLGRVSDEAMVPLIRGAMAFCFPSSYEGFGFPVIEAMACGTPVICSDRGSLKEVAGDAGLILDSLNSKAIAHAMIRVSRDDDLRSGMRSRGIENARRFQWEESIAAHADVFKEVSR
jgi:alpha-1,3-rhamnosyl/mannosyltransferase